MPVQLNGADLLSSFSDVEEGTFTPQIADENLNGSGESQAYTLQVGHYTKIGNRVLFNINITTSSIGCLATCEQTRIVGLPFTSDSTTNNMHGVAIAIGGGLAVTAQDSLNGLIANNSTNVQLYVFDATTGTSILLLSEWSADGSVRVSGQYQI